MNWVMERERERVAEDCLGPRRPKSEIREGIMGEDINVVNGRTFIFDYCTSMIGRHSVGVVFLDLHCKPIVCCLSVS